MMEIEQILNQPWSQRLAWSLLHFLWQGLVIAAFLSVAMRALRRRSANLRYAVACMALIVMVVAPVVTFCVIPAGPTGDASAGPAVQKAPDVMMPVREYVPPVANMGPSHAPAMVAVPAALPDADREASAPTIGWTARASRFIRPALPWMVAVWVAGVALLGIWHIGGWVGLVRLKQSALPLTQAGPETRCVAAARRIARQLGFSKPIRLLKSARLPGQLVAEPRRDDSVLSPGRLVGLQPHPNRT